MGFLEELQERQARKREALLREVQSVRGRWLGRRVVVYAPGLGMCAFYEGACVEMWEEDRACLFGEVVEVSEYGEVRIAYAVGLRGEVYYHTIHLDDLGKTCIYAEPLGREQVGKVDV